MTETIPELMERASVALVDMDYLQCEALCLKALALARAAADWAAYARIVLPLQEARRQRRMIALDGRVGVWVDGLTVEAALAQPGCVVVEELALAASIHEAALDARVCVEVLCVSRTGEAKALGGLDVSCPVTLPESGWAGRWIEAGEPVSTAVKPADWFIAASEALGDAAIAPVAADDVEAFEARVAWVPDHEKLHQALARAASLRAAG